jgi:hypothetical protein
LVPIYQNARCNAPAAVVNINYGCTDVQVLQLDRTEYIINESILLSH